MLNNVAAQLVNLLTNCCSIYNIKRQLNLPLPSPELWGVGVHKGQMAIGSLLLKDLAYEYGTPLLIFNLERFSTNSIIVNSTLNSLNPGSFAVFSYKTTPVAGVLKEIHALGLGAEVISPYELWLACQLGVPGEKIVYNGVNKDPDSLDLAIEHGVLAINVDAMEEVAALKEAVKRVGTKANVGIRLGFNEKNQFGLSLETGEALDVAKSLALDKEHFNFSCIHFHVTSGARTSRIHVAYAMKALEFMQNLFAETGVIVPYLDIGGGIGSPTSKQYDGLEFLLSRALQMHPLPPRADDFEPIEIFLGKVVAQISNKCQALQMPIPKILFESGRFITGSSGILLTEVRSRKKRADGRTVLIGEAGRLNIALPMDFQYHEIFDINRPGAPRSECLSLVGRVCASGDWAARMKLLPNDIKAGDILAIMDAGAYFTSFANTFAFPRPPILLVNQVGGVRVIRRKETYEDLVRCDMINFKGALHEAE